MPCWEWNAVKTLTRQTPVPTEILYPVTVPRFHVTWIPVYLVGHLQKFFFVIDNFQKPSQITYATVSQRVRESIESGSPHRFWGEVDGDSLGVHELESSLIKAMLHEDGRAIDGWGQITDLFDAGMDEAGIVCIRPGREAEKYLDHLFFEIAPRDS